MVNYQIVGCGVFVASMIASSKTIISLKSKLKYLELNSRLIEISAFMIDCSVIEVTAIKAAFDKP